MESDRQPDSQSVASVEPSAAAILKSEDTQVDTRGVFAVERRVVHKLIEHVNIPNLSIVLWNGETFKANAEIPQTYRVTINNRRALWQIVLDPQMQFPESYATGQIEFEGDLIDFLDKFYRSRSSAPRNKSWINRCLQSGMSVFRRMLNINTIRGCKANIHHHYDIGNDFYRIWLDRQMLYSCAYFPTPDVSLDDAQIAKMDHICQKLELRRDELVFDVGGGWGALAIHMAKHYGVKVKAFNISEEQIDFSRRRLKAEGLDSRVEFIQDDYRNINGRFDAFVSVGMFEHVGSRYYHEFGRVVDRCLGPNGRGLLHSIGQDQPIEGNPWIRRRIFPGGYIPSLRQMLEVCEPLGISIIDVENLRLHYAKTLRLWLNRFNAAEEKVLKMFGADFVRTWRMYLSGSAAAFESGALQLFQVLFSRSGINNRRWNRAEMYSSRRA
jgi:cyclopropane-fatty-acyl-phospholipid synthase